METLSAVSSHIFICQDPLQPYPSLSLVEKAPVQSHHRVLNVSTWFQSRSLHGDAAADTVPTAEASKLSVVLSRCFICEINLWFKTVCCKAHYSPEELLIVTMAMHKLALNMEQRSTQSDSAAPETVNRWLEAPEGRPTSPGDGQGLARVLSPEGPATID
ncbi:hypothetical protein AMECASPLE_010950 [Ameca splendens]|uniref:Uncharacterized protein n=1 Tax=Ameca splendens TaxID=208324 RepID=A0ABV0ZAE9_9TELE